MVLCANRWSIHAGEEKRSEGEGDSAGQGRAEKATQTPGEYGPRQLRYWKKEAAVVAAMPRKKWAVAVIDFKTPSHPLEQAGPVVSKCKKTRSYRLPNRSF